MTRALRPVTRGPRSSYIPWRSGDGRSQETSCSAIRKATPVRFASCMRSIAPRLLGYLTKMARSRALADDLLQQTFLKVHRARAAYVRGADPVPWMYADRPPHVHRRDSAQGQARDRAIGRGRTTCPEIPAGITERVCGSPGRARRCRARPRGARRARWAARAATRGGGAHQARWQDRSPRPRGDRRHHRRCDEGSRASRLRGLRKLFGATGARDGA